MSRGLFITLEGSDGSGKTTQIEYIKKFFTEKNIPVVLSREPGGTNIGEQLRQVALDKKNSEMTAATEMLIYAAARAQHVSEKILPAIERGDVVICDRFVDSSIAYQGYGRDLGDIVEKINSYATGGIRPDITFFMDIDPGEGRARIGKSARDRLESEKAEFYYKVCEGYRELCKKEPERIIRIDAAKSIDDIRREIAMHLNNACGKFGI